MRYRRNRRYARRFSRRRRGARRVSGRYSISRGGIRL